MKVFINIITVLCLLSAYQTYGMESKQNSNKSTQQQSMDVVIDIAPEDLSNVHVQPSSYGQAWIFFNQFLYQARQNNQAQNQAVSSASSSNVSPSNSAHAATCACFGNGQAQ